MSEVRKSAICVLHSIIHLVDENKVEQIGLKYFLKEHYNFYESVCFLIKRDIHAMKHSNSKTSKMEETEDET